jgi:hypothetical protein
MKKVEVVVSVTHEFSQEDINDLVSTALEYALAYYPEMDVKMIEKIQRMFKPFTLLTTEELAKHFNEFSKREYIKKQLA